jgi:siroheme synthase-like protein
MDLAGRAVVLLAADAGLVELGARLVGAGAGVAAFDPAPAAAFEDIPGVRLQRRRWRAADLKGASLVIAGSADRRPIRARAAAKAARAVFHAPGAPELSDVAFGADLALGPLAIGVAAAGLDPGLEQAVRARIEAAFPNGFASFLEAAQRLQGEAAAHLPDRVRRALFWREAAAAALNVCSAAAGVDWEAWLRARLSAAVQPGR